MRVKLSAIQLNSTVSVEHNLQTIAKYLATLTQGTSQDNNEHIVVLPECCLFFGANDQAQLLLASNTHLEQSQIHSELQRSLANLAKQYQVTLIAGTIPILAAEHKKFTIAVALLMQRVN